MNESNFGSATAGADVSDLPQPPQNFSLPSFRKPHDGHVEANERPHSPQNRRPSRFSAWHRGHCMPEASQRVGARTGRTGGESLGWQFRSRQGRMGPDRNTRSIRSGQSAH